jgi:LPXTG-motif cell wall-anchored protein
VGTAGQNPAPAAAPAPAPAPRQQAASELPKTASPYSLIGLLGLLSLAGGFGLRLARDTY